MIILIDLLNFVKNRFFTQFPDLNRWSENLPMNYFEIWAHLLPTSLWREISLKSSYGVQIAFTMLSSRWLWNLSEKPFTFHDIVLLIDLQYQIQLSWFQRQSTTFWFSFRFSVVSSSHPPKFALKLLIWSKFFFKPSINYNKTSSFLCHINTNQFPYY